MLAVAFLYLCFTAIMFLNSLIMLTNPYPLFVAGMRILGAGIILLSLYISKHKKSTFYQLKQLFCIPFMKYILFLYVISASGFSYGIQYIDPVKACFIFVLSPFITALMLFLLYDEKLTKVKFFGLTIGFLAVIPIILESNHGNLSQLPWHLSLLGYFIFICAIISFSYGWIVQKELLKVVHISSSLLTSIGLIVGGTIILLIFSASNYHGVTIKLTETFWWLLLVFNILTAISYNLYSSLLKQYSATFVSFASFLEPAFGMIYAFIFLGNAISRTSLCALVALGFGLYLFYREELNSSQLLL